MEEDRKSVAVLALQFAQTGIGALTALYLAIVLDALTYGKYVFISTVSAIAPLFVGVGTEHVLIMEGSRDDSLVASYLGNSIAVRLVLSFVVSATGGVILWQFGGEDFLPWLLIWTGSFVAAFSNPLFMAVYRIKRHHLLPWVFCLAGTVLFLVYLVVLGRRVTLPTAAAGFLATHFVTLLLFVSDIRRRVTLRFAPAELRPSLAKGLIFATSQGCDYVFARMDIFLVQALCGPRSLGVYSVAQRIVSMLQLIPASLNIVELPEFHRAAVDPAALGCRFRNLRRILLEVGLVVHGLVALNAAFIVQTLFPGEYRDASPFLVVLCANGVVLFINYPYYMLAEAVKAIRARMVVRIVTLLFTVVVIAAGIYALGAIGAAYGLLLGQLLFFGLLHRLTRNANGGLITCGPDVKFLLLCAGGLAIAVLARAGSMNPITGAVAASVAYLLVVLGLGYRLGWVASYNLFFGRTATLG